MWPRSAESNCKAARSILTASLTPRRSAWVLPVLTVSNRWNCWSAGLTRRSTRLRKTAGTGPSWPGPTGNSRLGRRPRLDAVVPGLQVSVLRLDTNIHHPGEGYGGEGIDVGRGKAVAADVILAFQVLVQEVHELFHALPAFFAPLFNGRHPVLEVAGGVLEAHAGGHEEIELQPAQPLLHQGFLGSGLAHQFRGVRIGFLKIPADGYGFGNAGAVIQFHHRYFLHGVSGHEFRCQVFTFFDVYLNKLRLVQQAFLGHEHAHSAGVGGRTGFENLHFVIVSRIENRL